MGGGMLSTLVATSNQLVLGHVHVWSFRCACLRSLKFGDRLLRNRELCDLLFFNLSFQCQFLGCFLSGGQGTCRKSWLHCIPIPMPLHLRQLRPATSSFVAQRVVERRCLRPPVPTLPAAFKMLGCVFLPLRAVVRRWQQRRPQCANPKGARSQVAAVHVHSSACGAEAVVES